MPLSFFFLCVLALLTVWYFTQPPKPKPARATSEIQVATYPTDLAPNGYTPPPSYAEQRRLYGMYRATLPRRKLKGWQKRG